MAECFTVTLKKETSGLVDDTCSRKERIAVIMYVYDGNRTILFALTALNKYS